MFNRNSHFGCGSASQAAKATGTYNLHNLGPATFGSTSSTVWDFSRDPGILILQTNSIPGWWFQPDWKMLVKMDQNGFIFPNFRGENTKYLSCQQLDTVYVSIVRGGGQVPTTYTCHSDDFTEAFSGADRVLLLDLLGRIYSQFSKDIFRWTTRDWSFESWLAVSEEKNGPSSPALRNACVIPCNYSKKWVVYNIPAPPQKNEDYIYRLPKKTSHIPYHHSWIATFHGLAISRGSQDFQNRVLRFEPRILWQSFLSRRKMVYRKFFVDPQKEVILWAIPVPSNSHHQDYCISSRGSLQTFICHCYWEGGQPQLYCWWFRNPAITTWDV